MTQPSREEITERLKKVLTHELSREAVGEWAQELLARDEQVEITDLEAWHYLVTVSGIDLMTAPEEYLYAPEDIQEWMEERDRP